MCDSNCSSAQSGRKLDSSMALMYHRALLVLVKGNGFGISFIDATYSYCWLVYGYFPIPLRAYTRCGCGQAMVMEYVCSEIFPVLSR